MEEIAYYFYLEPGYVHIPAAEWFRCGALLGGRFMFWTVASVSVAFTVAVTVTLWGIYLRPLRSPKGVPVTAAKPVAEQDPGAWAPVLISSNAALLLDDAAKVVILAFIKSSGNPRVHAIELIPDDYQGVDWKIIYDGNLRNNDAGQWILVWHVTRVMWERSIVVDVELVRDETTFPKARK